MPVTKGMHFKCSICGSAEHTKARHGKKPAYRTQAQPDGVPSCSICGSNSHTAPWHRQEQVKALTEKKCKVCGETLPISIFRKSVRQNKEGGELYISYDNTCRACWKVKYAGGSEEAAAKMRQDARLGLIIPSNPQKVKVQNLDKDKYDYTPKTTDDAITKCFKRAQGGALARGIDFDLEESYVRELYSQQSGRCFYSGLPLETSGSMAVSIDRIDSSEGYYAQNVVLCCGKVNIMKNDMAQDDFLMICEAVHKKNAL